MKRAGIALAVVLLGAGIAAADPNLVTTRIQLMKDNGKSMAAFSQMVKGDKPYDQAAVDVALAQLDESAKKLPTLYPASIKDVKQTSEYTPSPKIWSDKAGFDAAIATFAKAVTEAKGKIKDADSLKAMLPSIGKSCSGCHETFRVKNG